MYRTAVIDVLIASLAIIAVDAVCRILFRRKQIPHEAGMANPSLKLLRVSVNILGLVCFAAVAGSGFLAVLTEQNTLSGYQLMAHVIAAPLFAVTATLIALFWTHRNQFTAADWKRLRLRSEAFERAGAWAVVLRKIFFWIALALSVPTMVSILAAMFPLPTPAQQQTLFLIHRSCALPLAAAGLLFAYFALMSWRVRAQD
jgi:hypothetical protein